MRRSARVKSKVECCICFLPLRFLDGATFGAVVALSRTRVCVAKRILDRDTTAPTIKVQSEGEESSPPTTFASASPRCARLPFALSVDSLVRCTFGSFVRGAAILTTASWCMDDHAGARVRAQ